MKKFIIALTAASFLISLSGLSYAKKNTNRNKSSGIVTKAADGTKKVTDSVLTETKNFVNKVL